jgi:GNAT superfamily N-acetyltransferase
VSAAEYSTTISIGNLATPRRATPADVPALRALVEAAYAKYVPRIGMRPLPMEDDYEARVANGQAWVLGDPVEALVVLEDGDGHLLVDNVAVRPDLQGRGLGRALLEFPEQVARERGYGKLRLYTNERMTENRALYAHLGWVELDRRTIERRHAVFMGKSL